MFSMFSPDSKIMQVLSRLTDLVLLNIVYLLTCLPVFTAGAATTALYTVTFRMMRREDNGILKAYFRSFRENFKQSTLLILILALILVPDWLYFNRFYQLAGGMHILCFPFVLIAILTALVSGYLFPWASQFRNATPEVLRNALLLCIGQLPRSFCIAIVNLLPLGLWILNYDLFLKVSFLWLALYFAAAAFINAAILYPVFTPYTE